MRLLLVEDEPSLRESVARKLHRAGYETDDCGDGETALEMLAAEQYDLVLLDLNLPRVDGMTVLRTLRKTDLETSVLILSAAVKLRTRWKAWTPAPMIIWPSRSIWPNWKPASAA